MKVRDIIVHIHLEKGQYIQVSEVRDHKLLVYTTGAQGRYYFGREHHAEVLDLNVKTFRLTKDGICIAAEKDAPPQDIHPETAQEWRDRRKETEGGIDKERFLKAAKDHGLTLEQIARRMKIDRSTLYRKLNGKSTFSYGEVGIMNELFTPEEMYEIEDHKLKERLKEQLEEFKRKFPVRTYD